MSFFYFSPKHQFRNMPKSKVIDLISVFHPLVPPLTANIWQERQQFYQALQPHTEEEEERMLIQALEQSKKDAEDG